MLYGFIITGGLIGEIVDAAQGYVLIVFTLLLCFLGILYFTSRSQNKFSVAIRKAIVHIFDEMNGVEGILVASKIADRVGITRSVIVNALRKFESAGVIESRSSGMKGTYIKVLNDAVFDELDKVRRNH